MFNSSEAKHPAEIARDWFTTFTLFVGRDTNRVKCMLKGTSNGCLPGGDKTGSDPHYMKAL